MNDVAIRTLPNGLTAVVLETHAAPVVALQCWVKVGAADEQADEAGLAHLHEHMLFKGTARRGTGAIAREVESHGGEINAWTSHDQTVYHLVLASEFLSEGLDVLSDALRASAFDEGELARETQVVVEEIKRSEDSPQRRLSRELFATAYAVHPYRLPVIGTPESVLGFTRPKILSFYRGHYAPKNVVVVAVGDVTPESAFAQIDRWFGDWTAAATPQLPRAPEPAQREPRAKVLRGGFRETRLALAFHIPGLIHPDVPALDLLALLLGQGESARLSRELKRTQRLFQEVHAYGYTPQDAGLFVAGGSPVRGSESAALDALFAELRRVREPGVFTEAELARAKHQLQSDQIYQRETVQGLARKVGYYLTATGSLEVEAEYLARLAQVTLDEVVDVARRYLVADHATFVALEAEGGTPLREPELLARLNDRLSPLPASEAPAARQPPATPPRAVSSRSNGPDQRARAPTKLQTFQLPSGGRLLIKPEPDVPVVAIRAAMPGGMRLETEADNGINALLARTLIRGAAGRSADAIAAAVDGMAAGFSAIAGRNSFGLRLETLAQHLDQGIDLFADCLLSPDFPGADVERERAQLLQEIHAREDNPAGLCFELLHKTLYTQHPYRLAGSGEQQSVQRLTAAQLQDYWRQRYPLSGLTLAVVGDVDPGRVRAAFERRLKPSGASPVTPPPIAPEARPRTPRAAHHPLAKAQTQLLLGYLGVSFKDPARHVLSVLSAALSGQGGRLFLELRDKQSLAYSVSSLSMEGVDPGYFALYIGCSPDKRDQALRALRTELEKVRQEPLRPEELLRAQSVLIGAHAIGLQRRAAVAGTMALDDTYGLGAENYLGYPARIRAVTTEDILAAARTFLDPSGEVLAEVGPTSGPSQASA